MCKSNELLLRLYNIILSLIVDEFVTPQASESMQMCCVNCSTLSTLSCNVSEIRRRRPIAAAATAATLLLIS